MRGFSLIEIMIVIIIIGVMATAGYPKMVQTIQEVRLEQKARAIFEDFCLARDYALASGQISHSQMNFYHYRNNANNPITSYNMVDYTGQSIRTVFMRSCNELNAMVTVPRCIISSDSVCIIPVAGWGASSTAPLSRFFSFDRNGTGYRRPVPGAPTASETLPVNSPLFYIKSLNLVSMMPVDELGTWAIQIQNETYRPELVKLP